MRECVNRREREKEEKRHREREADNVINGTFLDRSCNKYCDVIGQEEVSISNKYS